MKRKFLEDLGLERDVIDKIMDENGRDIEAAKGDLSTITAERDSLKTQATDYNKQIEALKASAGDNEALKQQIAELQAQNKSARINSAVDMALTIAKAKNVKAVKALLEGLDKAEFGDDGKVKGLEDQIKKLQGADDTKFLFAEEVKLKGMQPKGATPADPGDPKPQQMTKNDFLKLSSKDQMTYIKDHPDWKNELI